MPTTMNINVYKKIISIALVIAFLLAMAPVCFAGSNNVSNYSVVLYSTDNGIPTGDANAVLQGADGYIWVGGYGGLLRYDGIDFEQFCGTRGLDSYSIRSLWQSNDGTIYVGSNEKGVYIFDGKSFTQPLQSSELKYLSVRCFEDDSEGRVFLGTSDGLAYIKDGVVCPLDFSAFGYSNSTVYTLSRDENGLIWGVDYAGALFAINPRDDSVAHYYYPGELWDSSLYAYSALVASDGSIYVGTSSSKIVHITFKGEVPSGETIDSGSLYAINAICEKASGEIWLCGDNGMGKIDSTGYIDLSDIVEASYFTSIIEDYEENIWAASSKYGLFYIKRDKISWLNNVEELENKETYSICRCGDYYYVGSENGLLVFDSSWQKLDHPLTKQLKGTHVHQVILGDDGNLYVGTYYNGLIIYNPDTGASKTLRASGSRCRSLLQLSNGDVALATNVGVDIISGGEIVKSYAAGSTVLCLLETESGSILCGTDGKGIKEIKNGAITAFSGDSTGLSGGIILRMRKDSKDPSKIFVSCGYEVFYGGREGFTKAAELSSGSGSVLDIFVDGDDIWLFRSSGIICCEREKFINGDTGEELYLSSSDGLPGAVCANSFSLFEDKQFAICTIDGIGILNADSIFVNSTVPKAIIENVSMNDGSTWDGSGEITLGKNVSKLSVDYAALSYFGNGATAKYWLEGFDEAPIERPISAQNSVEYTNLKEGSYTFRLKVINRDGVESEEQTLSFVKEPRFAETVWFYVMLMAIAAALATLIAQVRIRMERRKREQYKQLTDQTIATISGAIDAKDPYTEGHSRRVAEFSVKIAKEMGMDDEDCERLRYIALLHDIGKIGVPDNILKKPDKLTDEEFNTIKMHTVAGGDILENFTMLPGVTEGARYHHERYDGKGYCFGLQGKDIPLFARIISVADAYDAMNSSRCYRKALSKEYILAEIEKCKGHQFDPEIADIAIELIKRGE